MSHYKPILYLVDMDDVVADWTLGMEREWSKHFPNLPYYGINRPAWEIRDCYPHEIGDKIYSIFEEPGFFRNLPVVPGAREAILHLHEVGDVHFCSTPLPREKRNRCIIEKSEWLEEHMWPGAAELLYPLKDKTTMRGDYLIDDRPDISGRYNPMWVHILFDRGFAFNKGKANTINWQNYKQVLAI